MGKRMLVTEDYTRRIRLEAKKEVFDDIEKYFPNINLLYGDNMGWREFKKRHLSP